MINSSSNGVHLKLITHTFILINHVRIRIKYRKSAWILLLSGNRLRNLAVNINEQ